MHMFVTKSHNKCDILYMIFYVYIYGPIFEVIFY